MNAWLAAAAVLTLGYLPCGWVVLRGEVMDRLAATQMAGALTIAVVTLLSVGLSFTSELDLALALAILSFPSTVVFAYFLEHYL